MAVVNAALVDGAVERWEAHGLDCMIRPSLLGPLNGYVRLPDSHPSRTLHYDAINVDVHGGLTYGPDEDGWVGFDTMHLGDWWDESELVVPVNRERWFRENYLTEQSYGFGPWTRARLHDEVERLAEQLAAKAGC